MRRSSLVTIVAILALPLSGVAQTDVACWNRDLERMDYFENPPEGGDNNFFTGVVVNNSTTNVTLLYPTKSSMIDFPQKLYRIRVDLGGPTPTACSNIYLNGLQYFMPTSVQPPAGAAGLQGAYNSANTYPDPGPTYSGGAGQSDGLSNGSFYRYRNWGANGAGIVAETAVTACFNALSPFGVTLTTDPRVVACVNCVSNSGYWLNPYAANNDIAPEAGVFSGNWLRFYPPKWTILSLAYKRLVNGPLLSSLREAVVAKNGGTGGQVVQKMLPQSCNGQGRPMNQKLGAIDGLSYTSNANPIAEMLFNTAWYMGGQNNPWVFSNPSTQGGAPMSNGRSGPCNSCTGDFLVLFSDGRGDTANPACSAYADGGIAPQCTAAAQCSTLGMGTEDDGNDFLDPSMIGGAGSAISGTGVRQTPGGTCDMDFADDVAGWMANNNVGSGSSPETIRSYVVGVGDPRDTYNEMTILQQIASRGNGRYLAADNFVDLEANIQQVFKEIISRATSFSSAAVATVQTHGYTSAFIPRFTPSGTAQWRGTLTRYALFNEFAAGCTSADYGIRDPVNPDGDNSCFDVFLTDKNNNFIEEINGQFVVADTSRPYDAGWPPLAGADGGYVPATPIWESGSLLAAREDSVLAGNTANARRIFTVAPNGTTGSYSSTLVPFTVPNASTIAPLLKLGGVNGDFCTTLGYKSRHTYVTENDCATDVIRFINGEDVLFQNPYNQTNPQPTYYHSRPNILGDIFHSTPVLVTPPAPTYLCDLGVVNQCVPSLYAPNLEPGGQTAYQTYYTNNQYRTEFVLVGGNDGMIHAFNAGNDTVNANGVHSFDNGTGQEMWAFIPPDLLPKLIRYVVGERHELLVDGTSMVRDIWVDGSGSTPADHQKQYDEYHTVAIVGEREGGRHWVALEVTDPMNPRFLWVAPNPGTTQDLKAGGSWNDLGPAPAPIGPIAEYDASGTFAVNGTTARERYVFATGGGYEAAYLRGRGFYVYDAWTGQQLWRYARMDSSGSTDPRNSLYPIAAPVSMLDTNGDGIFDTAVVGDVHGQVWTFSLLNPATVGGNNLYSNWYGGRAFIQFKGQGFYQRSPFFERAAATSLANGAIRVYMGSGDRDQIKDPNGGTCGLANLQSCIRKNCSVSVSTNEYRVGSAPSGGSSGHYFNANWSYTAGASNETTSWSVDTSATGDTCSDVDDGNLSFSITCGSNPPVNYSSTIYCDWGAAADGGAECPTGTGRPLNTQIAYTPPPGTIQNSYFYGIRLFDSSTRAQFTSSAQAGQYDNNALTETNLVNATDGGVSAATDNGFYITHGNSIDEKTASSALVLAGCALWNTLVPNPSGNIIGCGADAGLPLDTAYVYQADVTSGAISCGQAGSATYAATSRFTAHSTYVAPSQPALVISINNNTGKVAYSGISIDPGSPPTSITAASRDLRGTIHWLEVPRKMHECRHTGANCN